MKIIIFHMIIFVAESISLVITSRPFTNCKALNNLRTSKPQTGLVEYIPGDIDSKIILTAPHGGKRIETNGSKEIIPRRCPNQWRKCPWVSIIDAYTIDILKGAAQEIELKTGKRPHMIISHLNRNRMDPNRDLQSATQRLMNGKIVKGHPLAIKVYKEYHSAIVHAKQIVKKGIIFDIHGQGIENKTQLGYILNKVELGNRQFDIFRTSVGALAKRHAWSSLDAQNLLFGSNSLGGYLEKYGLPAVPSPKNLEPGMMYNPKSKYKKYKFFRGGFTVQCHGPQNNGEIDAVQMELPSELRLKREGNDDSKRNNVGQAVGNAISEFYDYWYKDDQDSNKEIFEHISKYELKSSLYSESTSYDVQWLTKLGAKINVSIENLNPSLKLLLNKP